MNESAGYTRVLDQPGQLGRVGRRAMPWDGGGGLVVAVQPRPAGPPLPRARTRCTRAVVFSRHPGGHGVAHLLADTTT